jgi:hypothetical protein
LQSKGSPNSKSVLLWFIEPEANHTLPSLSVLINVKFEQYNKDILSKGRVAQIPPVSKFVGNVFLDLIVSDEIFKAESLPGLESERLHLGKIFKGI